MNAHKIDAEVTAAEALFGSDGRGALSYPTYSWKQHTELQRAFLTHLKNSQALADIIGEPNECIDVNTTDVIHTSRTAESTASSRRAVCVSG